MRATSDYNLGKLYPNIVKEWHPIKIDKYAKPYHIERADSTRRNIPDLSKMRKGNDKTSLLLTFLSLPMGMWLTHLYCKVTDFLASFPDLWST